METTIIDIQTKAVSLGSLLKNMKTFARDFDT